MNGVVFDFNGTIFYDSHFHEEAWIIFVENHINRKISEEEKKRILGMNNRDILEFLLKKDLTKEEVYELSEEKEEIYRDLCLKNRDEIKFIPGFEEFLEKLKDNNIAFNIATGSPKSNLDFYFRKDIFDLSRWFDYDKIVYDDGKIKQKPSGDIYVKACKNIGLKPEDTIIFEDSLTGIKAGIDANVLGIIAIDPKMDHIEEYKAIEKVIGHERSYLDIKVGDLFGNDK